MQKRNVPFFSLAKQTKELKTSLLNSISDIIETQQFIGGSIIADFEKKLAGFFNASNAVSCNSGTDALWLALKALNLKESSYFISI